MGNNRIESEKHTQSKNNETEGFRMKKEENDCEYIRQREWKAHAYTSFGHFL